MADYGMMKSKKKMMKGKKKKMADNMTGGMDGNTMPMQPPGYHGQPSHKRTRRS